mmetsp:Transcript_32385/g.91756  ORF Transcript_32385/g.91756 Transcript_32385/m.91756 type:complete len:450 (-) Transcript_32385:123-1472(-)|eukprot:CAMPEP_0117648156 /NCGR_PEP_ID=MMETSP0804-20121206/239_1 /TAXON_ID=1074897 /ORGANISM="Tetraselmis astigmatica, Strain CCMP880" /LENGTH=449 /DNA_ID=CAMNT_0005453709 /DNA_START=550 /DNA_END=1899 /DNA_ORIENTATION=-
MPLYVTRVPTVLSLNQWDGESPAFDEKSLQLLTPDAAVVDVTGSYLPTYNCASGTVIQSKRIRSFGDLLSVPDVDAFVRADLTGSDTSGSSDEDGSPSILGEVPDLVYSPVSGLCRSALDGILTTEWDKRQEQGLFRYDVARCESKKLPGKWGFIAQCNEGRGSKKRATEYRIDQVVQEFESAKFNFTMALQKEVLFVFDMGSQKSTGDEYQLKPVVKSPSLVFINVSPIEYGHVLLVPSVLDCLPQQATPDTVLTCLAFVKASQNPYFRAGFNSLGAYGTINHLHFQAYYLHAPFPIERALTRPVDHSLSKKRRFHDIVVNELVDYPVRALVFEAGDNLQDLADAVGTACQRLAAVNQPHNLIFADEGARVFLIPQCFAERQVKGEIPQDVLESQVNPAAFEIAGHIPLKRAQDYISVTEESTIELLAAASLPDNRFKEVVSLIFSNN